ncbi:MAG: hypothetical protein HKN39_07460 [Flavobacteriales bacterium]|nr:hypothetical protein [Flavobacteriales bacterium]
MSDINDLFDEIKNSSSDAGSLASRVKKTLDEAEIGVGSVMSKTKEQLEKIESAVDAEAIINATTDSVLQNEKKFGSNLAKVMSALQNLLDEIGVGFEDIRDLNDEEQGWIDKAQRALDAAKEELEQKEGVKDNWWNNLWGRKNKILKAKEEVDAATKLLESEGVRARAHHQERLENEPLEKHLERMITIVTMITNFVQGKMSSVDEELQAVTVSQKDAFELQEQAATAMKTVEADIEKLKSLLQSKLEELAELTPGTPEHTSKQRDVEEVQKSITEQQGNFEVARSIYNSKERFVELHSIAIEALETQKKNLKADLAALKSDTKERESFYAATITSLRAAAYQKVTSTFEKAGVKTDERSAEMLAQATVGSQRARLERVESQGARLQTLDEVAKVLMDKQREFARRSIEANEKLKDHYGIDSDGNYIVDNRKGEAASSEDSADSGKKSTNEELSDMLG